MQVDEIAKHRFESFKLGLPSPTAPVAPQHRHVRSHSRNVSISSTASLPTPKCTTTHDIPPTQSLPPPPKRNSHHRRISSVSTRRESAELMGVSVSDPSTLPVEEAAERESIRRNALWALEGKRDASYSKVEIPELPTPFDFPSKPSFPPGSGAFMNTAKRESFKPSSTKDFLGTLVEEEEEEEDPDKLRAPPTPTTPTTFTRILGSRPRPPHLSLRPLSLTPDSLPLHTPSPSLPTPSSVRRSSLKALALVPDATISNATVTNRNTTTPAATLRPRPVLNLKLVAEPQSDLVSASPEDNGVRPLPPRRSSISYKSSSTNAAGLPTPENTPTGTERRFSAFSHNSFSSRSSFSSASSYNRMSIAEEDPLATSAATRPLSASEQHFLFQSHNALVARITDLERALSFRTNANGFREGGARPSSIASAVSATSSSPESGGEPLDDEMLRLVADLKAERDELKRDVDGWRVRVGDMEKQLGVFANRVEVERRDAWVARTRVGLLEVERGGLEKRVGELESDNERLMKGEAELKQQVAQLLEEKEKMAAELREAKNKVIRDHDPLSTPRAFGGPVVAIKPVSGLMKRGFGFNSLDSGSSATDVEDGGFQPFLDGLGFKLRAVEEEEADDDDSGLAGYEDEDENDVLISPSSSFGSVEEFYPRRTALELPMNSMPTPQPVPAPASTHANRASISKTWTFPRGVKLAPVEQTVSEVDRFFGCLEDLDDLPSPSSTSPKYSEYDEEASKGMFAKGFSYGDDVSTLFVLPPSVMASAVGSFGDLLDVVEEGEEEEEEEEEETEGETVVEDGEVNGGIKITFTPPAEDRVTLASPVLATSPPSLSRKAVLMFEDDDEGEEEAAVAPFKFGQPRSVTRQGSVAPMTPPLSRSPRPVSPSSIPRPIVAKPSSFTLASPSRASVPASHINAFVTPPSKRGGTTPSFIPQPTSPVRTSAQRSTPSFSTNASTKLGTTFIRQPARQPLMSKHNNMKTHQTNADAVPDLPLRRASNAAAHQGSAMNSVDLSVRNIPTGESPRPNPTSSTNSPPSVAASSSFSSIMSSPLAGRLSFQTFTNYIPSWGMTPPRGAQSDAAGHDSTVLASPAGTMKPKYVSKQSQLERLRNRLERETLEGRSVLGRNSDDDAVFL
ncbi:hypothetical protein B0H15DRAFT_843026 [Mycena belliarum]|uniref:Uncharacterized protein n=1 Tax=Mycena belliarum TaxID=1033014 RepID=A0AAD6U2U6_9AGAR|nr:hypothetical protein B0H15DRAFT_843026 [Mycena belliae]